MYLASFDLLHCNCLSSPGSCPGPDVVHRPSGLQYEINLVIIIMWSNFLVPVRVSSERILNKLVDVSVPCVVVEERVAIVEFSADDAASNCP